MLMDEVKDILATCLFVDDQANTLHADSRLLGSLPELDSMAVVSLVTALEDHFGITFDDDDLNATSFATLGSLATLVAGKLP